MLDNCNIHVRCKSIHTVKLSDFCLHKQIAFKENHHKDYDGSVRQPLTANASGVYRQHRSSIREWKYRFKKRKTGVYSSPWPWKCSLLPAAQCLIIHCLTQASVEVVTKVFWSIQARPLMWCNRWVSADKGRRGHFTVSSPSSTYKEEFQIKNWQFSFPVVVQNLSFYE